MGNLCGWLEQPAEVDRVCQTLPQPLFQGGTPRGTEPVLLYKIHREIAGEDDLEHQGIGDCVGWGTCHLTDGVSAVEIHREIQD